MQFLMTHFICSFLKDGLLKLNKLLPYLNLLMSQETSMMRNVVTLLRSIPSSRVRIFGFPDKRRQNEK